VYPKLQIFLNFGTQAIVSVVITSNFTAIMKTINFVGALAAMTLLAACHNPDQKWDSKSSADTLNNMKDSVANPNVSVTKDLVMKVNKTDAKFAVAAANGGLSEVELGKLAQEKGLSQQVKDFGAMMVKDHSAANLKMAALAKSKGISLPATISASEQKLKDDLAKKSGKDFDKAYVGAMIDDHQEDIKSFESALVELKDPELRAFATEILPTLKMHLVAIQNVQAAIK
jgi:putative membrane protein